MPSPLQGFPLPSLSDPPNGPEQIETLVEEIEKRVVMRFSTAAARDAAITSPEEGMVVYLTTDNYGCYYDGTSWVGLWGAVPWIAPTFTNSWTNFGSGFEQVGYRKIGDTVFLRGLASGGTTAAAAALTLPVGYRPPEELTFTGMADTSRARIDVTSAGVVELLEGYTNTTGFVSLSQVSFSVTS